MAQTAQTLVTRACAIARVPGQTILAGQIFNDILQDLAETYDLEVARKTTTITLTPSLGSGPYPLPQDYLRIAANEAIYQVFGVPYSMINIELQEFDSLVQTSGISNYPEMFATDTSNDAITKFGSAVMYVWPPSGGVYVPQIRYWAQPPSITSPETSSVIPWFPSPLYLVKRLAGELCSISSDPRAAELLNGAQEILKRYLMLQSDDESRAKRVTLDRRMFGRSFNRLPQTKTLGW